MRGIFCFSITLVMLAILLNFSIIENGFYSKLEKGKSALIEMESGNKERTIIENNVDKIVSTEIAEQIENGNLNSESIKDEINSSLAGYLKGRANASTIFSKTQGSTITKEFLNGNSNAFILELGGKKYGEYSFASNAEKTNIVSKTFGNNAKAIFTIPIDYTIRKLAGGVKN
ncbi:MAG: hypothetical protein NTZ73_04075 [Candidatus Diapherotrites archaeon]|nr:hypothetical protein [Candidatus Diapherotrites archaeon]